MIKYSKYKKVLFCADFSENCNSIFEYAFGVAKRDDSILYILYIIPEIIESYTSELKSLLSKENIITMKKSIEKSSVEKYEKNYLSKIKDKGKVKFILRHGREENEIIGFAKEENVDIIVIGTHGKTGMEHVFLGSIAEKVVQYSPIPIFVIPCKTKVSSNSL